MNDRLVAIECENLSFSFGREEVLSSVSLKIFFGEFVLVFGPNGGGKTTLIKLLLGLLPPTKGRISSAFPKGAIGYVPQRWRYDPLFPITVLDVVLMGGIGQLPWHGRYTAPMREKAQILLGQLGLLELAKKPFSKLSGGEMQRVLLARALFTDPPVMILDEPLANVDIAHSESIAHTLLLYNKRGGTVVMVTHDLGSLSQWTDKGFCVQKTVRLLHAEEICRHFAVGLYQ